MPAKEKLSTRERDTGTPPSYEVWLDEVAVIKGNPLTFESQINIIAFAYKFRYATLKNNPTSIEIDDRVISFITIFDALTKNGAYSDLSDAQILTLTEEADKLPFAPVQLGETTNSFKDLLATLKNPLHRAAEFSIDANNPAQLHAAKILLETVCNVPLQVRHDLTAETDTTSPYLTSIWAYNRALCDSTSLDVNYDRTISPKNRLLMQGDPIQKIASDTDSTSLAVLLANTHFSTGEFSMRLEDETGQSGDFMVIIQDREEYRRLIKKELTRLYDDSKTKHVLAALGEIMRGQECHLILTKFPTTMDDFAIEATDTVSVQGYYDNKNALVCAGFIFPYFDSIVHSQLGFVIHEALHLIFNKLLKNESSPVSTDADIEELDRLIAYDQAHRHTLRPNAHAFTEEELCLWNDVVATLEEQGFYFEHQSEEGKKQVMRKEIIVRPMQHLAAGCSEEAIQKIMPNIWGFYQNKCQPMIEAYVSLQQKLSIDLSNSSVFISSSELPPYPGLSDSLTTLNLVGRTPSLITQLLALSDINQDRKPSYG